MGGSVWAISGKQPWWAVSGGRSYMGGFGWAVLYERFLVGNDFIWAVLYGRLASSLLISRNHT